METEQEVIRLIQKYATEKGKAPTVQLFAEEYALHPSSIVRKYGSWNKLLRKAGLKPNKADKRSDDQLIGWIKAHPEARYAEIPYGIRNGLEERYGTISKARKIAGLRVADWRTATKRRRYHKPQIVGRPIEFTEEVIVNGLQQLASRFGRPPRIRDITKRNCGFTPGAVIRRFGTLNAALQAASLPVIYSHQEQAKLMREFEIIMMNVKLALNDIPRTYNFGLDGSSKPTFVYSDRCEDIYLKRSDIFSNIGALTMYKTNFRKIVAWFLIDDSLNEDKDIDARCALDIVSELEQHNPSLAEHILHLRKRFDDISRKYVGQPLKILKVEEIESSRYGRST